ncbi:MAG TPA: zinc ribbon domain-containing protein [Acidimicrobiales bacterium]|nr:zinc ribbon domain-containing protein [Acidimicrobiales bacterium]
MQRTDEEVLRRFPRTRIDHDNKDFYKGWLDRQLVLNRCADCGHWHHPPRPMCPRCWSTSVEPAAVSGRGTVHLLIRLHQGPEVDGVDYTDGWPVATIELEEQEGLRYTSTVVGADRSSLVIGLPVELDWIEREGEPFPVFRPRAEA